MKLEKMFRSLNTVKEPYFEYFRYFYILHASYAFLSNSGKRFIY